MTLWTATHTHLLLLAVLGTLLGPSYSSPFPHNKLCYSAGGQEVPCDTLRPTHSPPVETGPPEDVTKDNASLSPHHPAVQRIHNGDLKQPGREAVSYEGYKLLRTNVNASQLPVVDSLDTAEGVDLWSWRRKGRSMQFEIDLLMPPAAETQVKQLFTDNNLHYQEVIADLQDAINEQQKDDFFFAWNRPAHPMTWEKYHSSDEMDQYLDYLQAEYPNLVTLEEIGKSYEGRSLRVAKVSTGPNKTAIWIDGGIHAREWISPATTLFILYRLVEFNWEMPAFINNFDWYILPLVNPDGYEFSRQKDRLWRKTRSINPNFTECVGVDANRNFGFEWNTGGSSNFPCSSMYHGSEPFSEPETVAIRDFLLGHKDQLKVYVSLHAYSQMWMVPYSHTQQERPSNYADLMDVSKEAMGAIKQYNGTDYTIGTVTDLLYVASGSSLDFAYGVLGIPYAFILELRDRGNFGFLLPKEQILPTAEETFKGIQAMAKSIFYKLNPEAQFS